LCFLAACSRGSARPGEDAGTIAVVPGPPGPPAPTASGVDPGGSAPVTADAADEVAAPAPVDAAPALEAGPVETVRGVAPVVLADQLVSPRALTPDRLSALQPAQEVYWISEGTVPHAWHRQGNGTDSGPAVLAHNISAESWLAVEQAGTVRQVVDSGGQWQEAQRYAWTFASCDAIYAETQDLFCAGADHLEHLDMQTNIRTDVGPTGGPTTLALDAATVYWVSRGALWRASRTNAVPAEVIATAVVGPVATPGVFQHSIVVFTEQLDPTTEHVYRAAADGVPEELFARRAPLGGVAVDGVHVYFTEPARGVVARAPLAGGDVEILATGQARPVEIRLDRENAYWLNAGSGAPDGQLVTVPK
jgi:hypothetical protein